MGDHTFTTTLTWTDSTGKGYEAYDRGHDLEVTGHPLRSSSAAAFGGEPALPNPERLVDVAHRGCFIAQSLRTEVVLEPTLVGADG